MPKSNITYVLEVIEFINDKEEDNNWSDPGGKYKHIGYMKAMFKTKEDAVSYYDRHNPHMRSLNAYNTYCSDWDSKTKLLYIVRDDHLINDTIDPFSKDDLPYDNGTTTTYKWLK